MGTGAVLTSAAVMLSVPEKAKQKVLNFIQTEGKKGLKKKIIMDVFCLQQGNRP